MYTSCTRSFISSISRVSRQTVTIILIFAVPLLFSRYVPSVLTGYKTRLCYHHGLIVNMSPTTACTATIGGFKLKLLTHSNYNT